MRPMRMYLLGCLLLLGSARLARAQDEPAPAPEVKAEAPPEVKAEPPPVSIAPPAPVRAPAKPAPRPVPPTPWNKDWLAPLLVVAGGVLILASSIDFTDQRNRLDQSQESWLLHQQALGSPDHLIADSVVIGVGAALALGGVLRWGLEARREKRQRALSVGAALDSHGGRLTVGGSF